MTEPLTPEQSYLVEKNIDLAKFLAMQQWKKNPLLDLDEMTAVAYQGLASAAARYDPVKYERSAESVADGSAFSSFARKRINGAVFDWQRAQDHVPRQQRRLYKDLQELGYNEGRPVDELSALTGMPEEQIRSIIAMVEKKTLSLDAEFVKQGSSDRHAGDTVSFGTRALDDVDTESAAAASHITVAMVEAWDSLPDTHQKVIALRYYAGLDLADIAVVLGVSAATVRYAHGDSLDILHGAMLNQVT